MLSLYVHICVLVIFAQVDVLELPSQEFAAPSLSSVSALQGADGLIIVTDATDVSELICALTSSEWCASPCSGRR